LHGYVVTQRVVESWVFQVMRQWHRITKTSNFGLRPTKGWQKFGQSERYRVALPSLRGARGGYTREVLTSDPRTGRTALAKDSSLRKLGRAMRQGKVPAERQSIIDDAMERATKRRAAYLNSSPMKREYRSAHR
jgi:hypothetical protein